MRCVADNEANRQAAGSMLRRGGVIAYPTDTLYGLGAVVTDIHAVERVFAIKGRPAGQGLPVLVASVEQVREVAAEVPPLALEMARRFWPGGLTLVLRKQPSIPDMVTGGPTIAVRQPGHAAPLALIAECGSPITGTSANSSGGPQPTTAQEVVRQLGEAVDLVLDGGPCPSDLPSTILDLTLDPARVLRVGAIAVEALREVCLVEVSLPADAPSLDINKSRKTKYVLRDLNDQGGEPSLTLVLMAGVTGTGKSTLASVLGRKLGWPVLDKDTYKSTLLTHGLADPVAGGAAYELMLSQAHDLLVEQGVSVILDSPASFQETVAKATAIAKLAKASLKTVLCTAQVEVRMQRLATRKGKVSQPTRPDERSIDETLRFVHLPPDKLTLDTAQPVESLVAEALHYISASPSRKVRGKR